MLEETALASFALDAFIPCCSLLCRTSRITLPTFFFYIAREGIRGRMWSVISLNWPNGPRSHKVMEFPGNEGSDRTLKLQTAEKQWPPAACTSHRGRRGRSRPKKHFWRRTTNDDFKTSIAGSNIASLFVTPCVGFQRYFYATFLWDFRFRAVFYLFKITLMGGWQLTGYEIGVLFKLWNTEMRIEAFDKLDLKRERSERGR